MPEPIEIKIDDKEIQQYLKKLAEKTKNLRPLMKNIAGIMMDSVEENFEKEGRPEKWHHLRSLQSSRERRKVISPARF